MTQRSAIAALLASIRKSTNQTFIAYSVTLLLVAGGTGLGYWLDDWDWLARAGSLIVIVGIILTSQQIFQHLDSLVDQQIRKGAGDRSRSDRDWAHLGKKHGLLNRRYSDEFVWRLEAHGLYLLITGTAIWGFGDLIGEHVISNLLP